MRDADQFDPERFRATDREAPPAALATATRPPRHRPGERFLKGPIPWSWIERAGPLAGKALYVGAILWQKAGMAKRRTVHLNVSQAPTFGLSTNSARRGLKALAGAGLIEVRHK